MFKQRPGFSGGVSLPVLAPGPQDTQIRQLAFAPLLRLPLRQHAGAASVAVVRAGQEVLRGELLAQAVSDSAVPLHAPATGRILRIAEQADADGGTVGVIELAPLPGDTQEEIGSIAIDPDRCSPEQLLMAIRAAGMVGLGGEASPTHLRLQRARELSLDLLVINGIEPEPGLSRVPALLARHAADLLAGIHIFARVLGARHSLLVVETPDAPAAQTALASMSAAAAIGLQVLPPRYPQGEAGLLLRVLEGRRLDDGHVFSAASAVVFSLATVVEVGRLLGTGRVLTDQLLSLAGDGLGEPGYFRVPLGTPVGFALEQAGAGANLQQVLAGGPMRGHALGRLDRPILKGATGFMAMAASAASPPMSEPGPCIRCGDCVAVCPIQLQPAELGLLARRGEVRAMVTDWDLAHCIECGCCSYVCPAHIPLAQMFRTAKAQWRRQAASAELAA